MNAWSGQLAGELVNVQGVTPIAGVLYARAGFSEKRFPRLQHHRRRHHHRRHGWC